VDAYTVPGQFIRVRREAGAAAPRLYALANRRTPPSASPPTWTPPSSRRVPQSRQSIVRAAIVQRHRGAVKLHAGRQVSVRCGLDSRRADVGRRGPARQARVARGGVLVSASAVRTCCNRCGQCTLVNSVHWTPTASRNMSMAVSWPVSSWGLLPARQACRLYRHPGPRPPSHAPPRCCWPGMLAACTGTQTRAHPRMRRAGAAGPAGLPPVQAPRPAPNPRMRRAGAGGPARVRRRPADGRAGAGRAATGVLRGGPRVRAAPPRSPCVPSGSAACRATCQLRGWC
jgi:hypothetical protein